MAIDLLEVNRALENGEFLPYFQLQVPLRSGKLTGFEVLARWIHATNGMIMPDDFIPLAERDGWIHALTYQILEKAFRLSLPLPGALQFSVNISPTQWRDPTPGKTIRRDRAANWILARAGHGRDHRERDDRQCGAGSSDCRGVKGVGV